MSGSSNNSNSSNNKRKQLTLPTDLKSFGTNKSKKAGSFVWEYYKLSPSSPGFAFCVVENCSNNKLSYNGCTTSNLSNHLRDHHDIQKNGTGSGGNQTTINPVVRSLSLSLKLSKSTIEHYNSLITTAFIDNCWSFNSIESPSFVKFIQTITNNMYNPPSRYQLVKSVEAMYTDMVDVLFEEVSKYCLSITADSATFQNRKQYVAVTGHYIDNDWIQREVVLSVQLTDDSLTHDGEWVRDLIQRIQRKYAMENRTFAIVTDNGSNFVKGSDINFTVDEKIRCAVHTLQLTLKNAVSKVPAINAVIEKARVFIQAIRASPLNKNRFIGIQKELNQMQINRSNAPINAPSNAPDVNVTSIEVEDGKSDSNIDEASELITFVDEDEQKQADLSNLDSDLMVSHQDEVEYQMSNVQSINSESSTNDSSDNNSNQSGHKYELVIDVATRFNSICIMIQRLLKTKQACQSIAAEKADLFDIQLLDSEWKILEELVQILDLFKGSSDSLEGAKYPTLGLVIPLIARIIALLENNAPNILPVTTFCSEVQSFALHCWADLRKRWLGQKVTTQANTRLQIQQLEKKAITDVHRVAAVLDPRVKTKKNLYTTLFTLEECAAAIQQAYREFKYHIYAPSLELNQPNSNSNSNAPNAPRVSNIMQKLFEDDDYTSESKDEIQVYWYLKNSIKLHEDPFKWWSDNCKQFPKLAAMAKIYLSVPASQAPSERVFSVAPLTVTHKRRKLDPHRVARLVFIRKNMKLYNELKLLKVRSDSAKKKLDLVSNSNNNL